MFGAVAQFERDIIQEQAMAGLEAVGARGRKGGHKPVRNQKKIAVVSSLMRDRETPISKVCQVVGISKATIYRYLKTDGTPRKDGAQTAH